MKLKHILSFVLMSLTLAVSPVLAEERAMVVGTGSTYRPFGYLTPDNKHIGFDVDIITAVAEAANFKINIVSTPFGALIPGLNNGDRDIVISAMTITPQRMESVDFSNPYQLVYLVALAGPGVVETNLADLKNRRVGVGLGQTADTAVSEAFGKTNPNIRRFENTPLLVEELLQGGVDVAVGDVSVMSFYLKSNPDKKLRIIRDARFKEAYVGIAVKKGNKDLLAKINAGLKQITDNGKYAQIYRKWFDQTAPKLPDTPPKS
jgi:polar amino acid transport system substrate-binding protein